tara:strand:- start:5664 stop:6242 length:579 start_codon:yes stop_codon:yes gene_type:complete
MSSKQKILMIDNYDSFTYNLVQYLGELGADIEVFRNNKISIEKIEEFKPEKIVISPGPGTPEKAGISVNLVQAFAGKIPILGVCLGHQSIGHAFGAKIVHAGKLMHGKTSMIQHDGKSIFENLPVPFKATRYHSLVIRRDTLSDNFEITAESEDNEIMGIRHKKYILEGIQFHPESIMTEVGKDLLENFLNL